MTTQPSQPASDDTISRAFGIEADIDMMERMKKQSEVRGFTIICDEGTQVGGDNTAPPPLAYFISSLVF